MRVNTVTQVLSLLVLVWIAWQLASPPAELAMLHEELRLLRASLTAGEIAAPATAPEPPLTTTGAPAASASRSAARERVGPDAAEGLVAAGEALSLAASRLDRGARSLPPAPAAPTALALQDVERWKQARAAGNADQEMAVIRDYWLLGIDDVVRRFGRPQWVSGDMAGVRVEYRRDYLQAAFGFDGVLVSVDFD